MRKLLVLFVALIVAACGGSTSPANGPIKLGIISGNNQSSVAGSQQLTNAVVGKMVYSASGMRFVPVSTSRIERAGDWMLEQLVPKVYAQDGITVVGSPVVGAVVCAHPSVPGQMEPFAQCTNTQADGTAKFFFTPGTIAGVEKAEIRGTLAGQPAVFDTAKATVLPGTAAFISITSYAITVTGGTTLDLRTIILSVADQYSNLIYDHFFPLQSAFVPKWTIKGGAVVSPAPLAENTNWSVTVPKALSGTPSTLYLYADNWNLAIALDVK